MMRRLHCYRSPPVSGWGLTLQLHALGSNHNIFMGSNYQLQFGNRGSGSVVLTPASRGPDGDYIDIPEADNLAKGFYTISAARCPSSANMDSRNHGGVWRMSFFDKLLGRSAPIPAPRATKAAPAKPDYLHTFSSEMLKIGADHLQGEVSASLRKFHEDGIETGRHAVKGINGLVYGAYMPQEHLVTRSALSRVSQKVFDRHVADMSAMFVLHVRMIRHLVKSGACDRFYVNSAREVVANGLWCALLRDLENAAFIHGIYFSDEDPQLCQAWGMDPEIDALFDLTLEVCKNGVSALATFDAESLGEYQPLLQALREPTVDSAWINAFVADRQARSIARFVTDSGEGSIFFADAITALFPLEIVALLKAFRDHRAFEVDLTDPFARYLWNLARPELLVESDGDLSRIAGFVAELELQT